MSHFRFASPHFGHFKTLPAGAADGETWVPSLGREDALEKEVATRSTVLAGRIPWTEEPGGLQSTGSQRVRQDVATEDSGRQQ